MLQNHLKRLRHSFSSSSKRNPPNMYSGNEVDNVRTHEYIEKQGQNTFLTINFGFFSWMVVSTSSSSRSSVTPALWMHRRRFRSTLVLDFLLEAILQRRSPAPGLNMAFWEGCEGWWTKECRTCKFCQMSMRTSRDHCYLRNTGGSLCRFCLNKQRIYIYIC